MEEYIYDNSNGLWYELNGDYYIPCLITSKTSQQPIGVWGRKHQTYLKEHRPTTYNDLILSGNLHQYLADIDSQVKTRIAFLTNQLTEIEGINEQFKNENQMAWVGAINNIRNKVEEIVNTEIIFV